MVNWVVSHPYDWMEEKLLNGQREDNDIDQIDTHPHNLKLDKFSSYQTNHLIYYTHVQCSRSQSELFWFCSVLIHTDMKVVLRNWHFIGIFPSLNRSLCSQTWTQRSWNRIQRTRFLKRLIRFRMNWFFFKTGFFKLGIN